MTQVNKSDKEKFERNAQIYKLLANAKRLEILYLLSDGEMVVTDLVNTMGIRKANVSQHLAILRYLKFVTVKRVGKNAFYSLVNPKIIESFKIMDQLWKDKSFNI
jgi:DNA-binding transcriptional ArsR family regulator